MSLKVHYLDSYLDYFPENFDAVTGDKGERFHHNTKKMERRYRQDMTILLDILKRNDTQKVQRENVPKRSFESQRNKYYKNLE